MVTIEEAEEKAVEFVKKKSGISDVKVTGVEPQNEEFVVRGNFSESRPGFYWSTPFTIRLNKEGQIISWKFETGTGFAIT